MGRRIEPAKTIADRGLDPCVRRPERRVTVEQALGPALVASSDDGRVERGGVLAEGQPGGCRRSCRVAHPGFLLP